MQEQSLYLAAIEIQVYAALLLKFYNQALDERFQAQGETLSSLQFGILRMLQAEELTISTLSQRMGLDPSTLVRAVDALERKGLAQRGTDPGDRRRNPLHLTPRGQELLRDVPVVLPQDATFQALRSLGVEQSLQLRDLLRQLVRQFPEGRLVTDLMAGQAGDESQSLSSSGKE